jgi:hypothetical protein
MVDLVLLESIGSVGSSRGTIGGWLRSARVERVNEAAVGADLDSRRTGRVAGESPGIGPVHRRARRRDNVGRGDGRRGDDGSRSLGHTGLVVTRSDIVARSSVVARSSTGARSSTIARSSVIARLRCRLGSLAPAKHRKEEAESTLLLNTALVDGSSLSGTSDSSLCCGNSNGLVVCTSYLGRTNTNWSTTSDSDRYGSHFGAIEVLRSGRWVGGNESSGSDESECRTHGRDDLRD